MIAHRDTDTSHPSSLHPVDQFHIVIVDADIRIREGIVLLLGSGGVPDLQPQVAGRLDLDLVGVKVVPVRHPE